MSKQYFYDKVKEAQEHWAREAARLALLAERQAAGVCLVCGGTGYFFDGTYTRACAMREHKHLHPGLEVK